MFKSGQSFPLPLEPASSRPPQAVGGQAPGHLGQGDDLERYNDFCLVQVKKVRGKGGVIKEQYDLIVNIDLVSCSSSLLHHQDVWNLSKETVADLKEVFMLFDKDEDGVLSFPELEVVMKNLGQRPSGHLPAADPARDLCDPDLRD